MNNDSITSGLGFGARVVALAVVLIALCGHHAAAQQAATPLSADEASAIATDAYVYGYSLITTKVTQVLISNVDKVEGYTRQRGNS